MNVIDFLNKLLGDPNDRELKRMKPTVGTIRTLQKSDAFQKLTLEDLPKRTEEFRERVSKGDKLDDLLPEAFALVLRACELIEGMKMSLGKQEFVWNMQPFDMQILGGIVLHRGHIAEMKTGEGKTLVCTMPVYLNALTGKGVHVVTVNDYLAKRDALWMGMLYEALGLSVGVIVHEKDHEERREAYAADVTYGTNNEFGFDYLRDNMATAVGRQVMRGFDSAQPKGLHYAIVDEVDSILIDEARTPLIISQPAEESTEKYLQYAQMVRRLRENEHFNRDEKQRVATLTEEGVKKMEEMLGVDNIYTERGFEEVHHIEQALRAHAIYQHDVDYVVKDGDIIIVDEFTGRLMPGRRFSHGLHQALEAKEGVEVQRESRTLATITFQNYFRLYSKLAGMTGTAKTEEEEFESIYKVRTFAIPTNMPMIREDKSDAIYRTVEAKFRAVAKIAKEKHKKGQPVLIGTTSIEKSEALSALLHQEKVPHEVLNAKQHQREAEIVATAGEPGTVTIATNMAGRGTDIRLGRGVVAVGGLAILGTERHEARRIDNQLRGRSGRQGDPGESQFFVSMEDDLMRLFGGDRLKSLMERLKVPDDQPLENRMVSRSIESAQKRVEGRNFDIRRHVVQYDDVLSKHREIIYTRRQKMLERIGVGTRDSSSGSDDTSHESQPLHEDILKALEKEAANLVQAHASSSDPEEWNTREIYESVTALHPALGEVVTVDKLKAFQHTEKLQGALSKVFQDFYEAKCAECQPEAVAMAERIVTLRSIDTHWMDHIDDMAHLREQVAFSGFAQRDPLIEYKDQGFRRFQQLLATIDATIVRTLVQIDFSQFTPGALLERAEEEVEDTETNVDEIEDSLTHTGVRGGSVPKLQQANPIEVQPQGQPRTKSQQAPVQMQKVGLPADLPAEARRAKVGRNDPCPCGATKPDGKPIKYKHCHGR